MICVCERGTSFITIAITKFIRKESLECIQLTPAVRMALNKLDLDLFFFKLCYFAKKKSEHLVEKKK